MSANKNLSNVPSAEQLRALIAEENNTNKFVEHLQEKAQPKPHSVENKLNYRISIGMILLANVLNVAAAYLAVFTLLNGLLGFLDIAAPYIAGALAFGVLVALEVAQWSNTTTFLETLFFHKTLSNARLYRALIFTGITFTLSIYGAKDTVAYLVTGKAAVKAELESIDDIKAHYQAQIDAAATVAKDFKKSRSYMGKLSDKDGAMHKDLLNQKTNLTNEMNAAIAAANARNNAAIAAAKDATGANDAEHGKQKKAGWIKMVLFSIISVVVFWAAFFFKEKYEYYCAKEMAFAGLIKMPTPPHQQQQKTNQTPQQAFNNKMFNQHTPTPMGFNVGPDGNVKTAPTQPVTQLPQPVTQHNTTGTSAADAVLKVAIQAIQADVPNFNNKQANPETVAKRLYDAMSKVMAQLDEGRVGQASPELLTKLYTICATKAFPALVANGYDYPYNHNKFLHFLGQGLPAEA